MNKMNNIKILLVIMSMLFCYYSCQQLKDEPWLEAEIINHRLELVSATDVKSYMFGENGFVAACIGKVNGPLTAPLYSWEILVDGSLKIYDYSEKEVEVIRKYKFGNGYVITNSGRYKYKKIK